MDKILKMNRYSRPFRIGYLFVILAAILWAISGSASKFLFNNGVSPFQLVQLRTTLAVTTLLIWLLIRQPELLKVSRKDLPYFFLLGISLASAQFTYLYAISKLQVAAAILLQYQAPIFIALYMVFKRKKLYPSTVAAIIGAISGCYLVVGAYTMDIFTMNRAGIIVGLCSAVAFAWYSVQSEYGMRNYRPWTVVFYALLFASIIWNILHPPLKAFMHSYSSASWWLILYIGVFGTILPFGFYILGINLISSTHASITATLEPIAAAFIAYFFLNEIMGKWQIIGAVLVIVSIVLLQIRQNPPETIIDVR
jgi:drug/metabolite transporter (DMT)-like permease